MTTKAISKYERIKNSLANYKEKAAEASERAVSTLVTGGTSVAYCYAKGRFYGLLSKKIPGTTVEIPLAAGIGLWALGVSGYAGKQSDICAQAGMGVVSGEWGLRAYMAGLDAAKKASAKAA